MKDHTEINQTLISGTITSHLELRKNGSIAMFEAETYLKVGKKETPETVRWRGICFGSMAKKAKKLLVKGIRVFVLGAISGHEPTKATRGRRALRIEIVALSFWTTLPMEIGATTEFGETSPEERRRQLEEDLKS